MNQDAIQLSAEQGFQTGAICTDSNLYRCNDDIFEVIEYIPAGAAFPNGPFGNGKGKTVWRKVTLATDGNRTKINGLRTTA